MATLGCAETYRVAVHAQGGRALWTWVGGLREIGWGRKRDDWSEAEVTLAKTEAGEACCGKLGQTRTWGHELTIYRDNEQEPCWQGPLITKRETRHSVTLGARDMLFWLTRRALNPTAGAYYLWSAPTDTGAILRQVITDAFADSDPGLLAYADLRNTGTMSTTDVLWRNSQPVSELVGELSGVGVDLFTIGRRIYLISDRTQLAFKPYRLNEDAFLDELEVRENGVDGATRGIAVGGQPLNAEGQPIQDVSPVIGVSGGVDPFYGRIDRFTSSPNTVVQSVADGLAGAVRGYGYPPPVDLVVPSGARLSPHAPVSLGQLVPGRPFVVLLSSYCTPVQQRFRLNELEVEWTKADVEKVAVSLSNSGPVEGVAA